VRALAAGRRESNERRLAQQFLSRLLASTGCVETLQQRSGLLFKLPLRRTQRGVRLLVHLSYDKDAITTWARTNLPGVLVLDTRTFEQVAPRLRVPGVTVHEEPQATIAQDLTAWE
jgi:hypothetical protein